MTAEPDVPQNHRRSQTAATEQALPLAHRQAGLRLVAYGSERMPTLQLFDLGWRDDRRVVP